LEGFLGNCRFQTSEAAELRGRREVHGQPQWRRKVTIAGFPLAFGICSVEVEGAFAPTSGAGEVVTAFGLIHELSSCWNVMMFVLLEMKFYLGDGLLFVRRFPTMISCV
jgi:hypothetical protein